MAERAMTLTSQSRFLAFRVAGRRYALPAETVAEIVPVPPVARLPHSPKSLLGLANLRGDVIPVVSLGTLLGQSDVQTGRATTAGVARAIVLSGASPLALPVDAVETLDAVDVSRVETRQAELAAEPGEKLLGAYHTGAAQIVTKILDIPALLAAAFGARSSPAQKRGASAALAAETTAGDRVADTDHRLLISFEVARQDYALPLDAVREITPVPETISVVPRAESVLLGITAWRGALLPLLSLRTLLGFAGVETATGREKVIVVVVNGAMIGLVADRALGLVRAESHAIDPAPAMLAARSGGESKITAIYRGDGGKHLISLLAPEQLFREDIMSQVGGVRGGADAAPGETGQDAAVQAAGFRQFVVFRLGDEEFGLPIGAINEVARVPAQVTRLPKMPKFLEGLVNLRGDVLPVVDQRRRFNMPVFAGTGRRLIVVQAERHRAGLIVDSVSEVLRIAADAIQPPPDLTGAGEGLVNGVINAGDGSRMILLLNPAELLTGAERRDLDRLDLDGARPEPGESPNG